MSEKAKSLLKYTVSVGVAALAVLALILKPITLEQWIEYAGYAIPIASGFAFVYEKWLWRWNPFESMPRLSQAYDGELHYNFAGNDEMKGISITVKQSLLHVQILAQTDMNSSNSISGAIIEEHGETVLYYQYITSPNLTTSRDNPMQYGAGRMRIEDKGKTLCGNYWTNRPSRGDMIWKSVDTENNSR